MKAIRNAKTAALLLAFGVLLAGCASPPTVGILPPKILGPPGHQFVLSFLKEKSGFPPDLAPPKSSPGVRLFSSWTSRSVDAFVYELFDAVPPTRVDPVLRNFLPASHGARMITWRGFPAATVSVSCSTQAGSCSGVINALVVLRQNTIYEVLVNAPTTYVSEAVFNSFRLVI